MRKRFRQTVLLAATGCLLLAGSAMAATVTFPDIYKDFPGYATAYGDQIINPAVGDMTVTYDDASRQLLSVSLQLTNRLVWDTLFINAGYTSADDQEKWDYIVLDTSGLASGSLTRTPLAGYPVAAATGIYEVNNGYDYTLATEGRIGHPNGIAYDDLSLLSPLNSGGYGNSISYFNQAEKYSGRNWDTLTYDFRGLEITLGQDFVIAYAPWCANDVTTSAVPEPAAGLLIGAGLLSLLGLNRRKAVKA